MHACFLHLIHLVLHCASCRTQTHTIAHECSTVQKNAIITAYISPQKLFSVCAVACVWVYDFFCVKKGWVKAACVLLIIEFKKKKRCQKGNSVFMARQISFSWQVYSHYVAVRSRRRAIVEPRARVPMHQRKPISLLVSPSKAMQHLQTPAGQNKVSYLWSSQQHADARETDNWMLGFCSWGKLKPVCTWHLNPRYDDALTIVTAQLEETRTVT